MRQKITLVCADCGEEFEATNRRKVALCKRHAEELRQKRLGPRQARKQAKSTDSDLTSRLPPSELDWSKAKDHVDYYLDRFSKTVKKYDGASPSELDRLTLSDRKLANLVAGRMGPATWAPVVGEPIDRIEASWDLLRMSDDEWQERRTVVKRTLAGLLEHPGIGAARLTKALHRKRPNLIPVCDSVLRETLGVNINDKAEQIVKCMDNLRTVGQANIKKLEALRGVSKEQGAELMELRILELLYWVQFGPFPL